MSTPLEVYVDTAATLAEFRFAKGYGNILKHPADLDRYAKVIADTAPEVIVECGTWSGASAAWFARQHLDVITIDIQLRLEHRRVLQATWPALMDHVQFINGSTTDPAVVAQVSELVGGRRCMVCLDSAHTTAHVAEEIKLYGPLVTPGCYLVVEDGIFRYASPAHWHRHGFGDPAQGNPLDAIEECLVDNPAWTRDIDIERMDPISHHPGGWWVRQR